MDPVAQTSRWMAAARARESERPDRLFDDPLAATLAGTEGFFWLDRMEPTGGFGGPALYVVVHTRFFDDFLLYACWGAGVRQIVLMAAGMDARAFRLDWPAGTRLYELDRPQVLAAKDDVLARVGAQPACERRTVGADLGRPSCRRRSWRPATTPGSRRYGSWRAFFSIWTEPPSAISWALPARWRRPAAFSAWTS